MANTELGFQLSDAKHTDLITCRLSTHHFCSCFCGSISTPASLAALHGRCSNRAGPQGGKLWPSEFLWNMYCHSVLVRRRRWHPTPVLFPGKSHGWRSLVGYSPWGHEELDRMSDFTFTFHFHALEKEMATHSSMLAWRIPGTGAWWATVYGVAQSRTRLM